jgi:glucokinase
VSSAGPSASTPGRIGIGIDVGGTKVLGIATTGDVPPLATARLASPNDPTGLLAVLRPLVEELLTALGERRGDVGGIGISLPGLVDASGILRAAPNLAAAATAFDLVTELATPLAALADGLRASHIAFENDATAAGYAEATQGAGRGLRDVLVVSLGTGIGAGIVSGGRAVRGAHGYAGELGHMVIDPNGPPCPCGRKGCFERYASGSGLAFLPNRADLGRETGSELRAEDVIAAARGGSSSALAVVEEFAQFVALGLVNAVEILDPTRIVLAGGLMAADDVILGPIRAAYEREARPAQGRRGEDLVPAALGEDAAAIGAALLGLELAQN